MQQKLDDEIREKNTAENSEADTEAILEEVKEALEDQKSRIDGLSDKADQDLDTVMKLVSSINDEYKIVIRKFFYEAERFNDAELERIKKSLSEAIEERRDDFVGRFAEINSSLSEQFSASLGEARGRYEQNLSRYIGDIRNANGSLASEVQAANQAFEKEIQKHLNSFYADSGKLLEKYEGNLRTLVLANLNTFESQSKELREALNQHQSFIENYKDGVLKLNQLLDQKQSFIEDAFRGIFQNYVGELNQKQAENYKSFGNYLIGQYAANVEEITSQLTKYQGNYQSSLDRFMNELQEDYRSKLEEELQKAMSSLNDVVADLQRKNRADQKNRLFLISVMIFLSVMTALSMVFSNGILSVAPILLSFLIAAGFYLIMSWRA